VGTTLSLAAHILEQLMVNIFVICVMMVYLVVYPGMLDERREVLYIIYTIK